MFEALRKFADAALITGTLLFYGKGDINIPSSSLLPTLGRGQAAVQVYDANVFTLENSQTQGEKGNCLDGNFIITTRNYAGGYAVPLINEFDPETSKVTKSWNPSGKTFLGEIPEITATADGCLIYFAVENENTSDIYVTGPDGRNLTNLTENLTMIDPDTHQERDIVKASYPLPSPFLPDQLIFSADGNRAILDINNIKPPIRVSSDKLSEISFDDKNGHLSLFTYSGNVIFFDQTTGGLWSVYSSDGSNPEATNPDWSSSDNTGAYEAGGVIYSVANFIEPEPEILAMGDNFDFFSERISEEYNLDLAVIQNGTIFSVAKNGRKTTYTEITGPNDISRWAYSGLFLLDVDTADKSDN